MESTFLNKEIGQRPEHILLDQLVRNTARLHLKLSDIVGYINHCYSFQVRRLTISICHDHLMNFYHPFYLQFMLFSLKVFVFVLSALYDSYAFFVSRRPGNLYMTLYTLYMALYATYYTSFLIVITRNGSRINSEVSILCFI